MQISHVKRTVVVAVVALGLAFGGLTAATPDTAHAEVVCTVTSNGGVVCVNHPDPKPTPPVKRPR